MISTFLWLFHIVLHYLITIILFKVINKDNLNETNLNHQITNITKLLENAYSFFEIVDSKLVGLCIFLIANVLTGLINLSIYTRTVSDYFSLIILILHSFASVGFAFSGYYYLYFKRRNHFSNEKVNNNILA